MTDRARLYEIASIAERAIIDATDNIDFYSGTYDEGPVKDHMITAFKVKELAEKGLRDLMIV